MIRILQFLLLAFILFIIGTVAAFHYLVWWQALLVVFGIIFAIAIALNIVIRSLGKMLGGAMTKALEQHAAVLRGAEDRSNPEVARVLARIGGHEAAYERGRGLSRDAAIAALTSGAPAVGA